MNYYKETSIISYEELIKNGEYVAYGEIEKGSIKDSSENKIFNEKYEIKLYRYHNVKERSMSDRFQIHIVDKKTKNLIVELNTINKEFNAIFIHQNNEDFVIMNENYLMGDFTIANLTKKAVKSYTSNLNCFSAYTYHWNNKSNTLTVYGWQPGASEESAGIIELKDLNNPIEGLDRAAWVDKDFNYL